MEGHPDNVAACLGGGLTIAWTADGEPRMVRLEPDASIRPVICVGPAPVRTDVARRLLPDLVPHRDAAANAGRSALLVAALTQLPAEPGTLLAATRDWLHQDYRAGAMPETAALLGRLRAAGIAAVVSGAGPSVLALLGGPEKPDYRRHLDSLGSIVRETGYCMAHKLARRRAARCALAVSQHNLEELFDYYLSHDEERERILLRSSRPAGVGVLLSPEPEPVGGSSGGSSPGHRG